MIDANREGVLLGIDVGSTLVKSVVVALDGAERSRGTTPTAWTSGPTGAEADPEDFVDAALRAARRALERATDAQVLGVGVTGMAETVALVDGAGRPVAPAIAWYDSRGGDEARELGEELGAAQFSAVSGLPVSTLCTLVKLRWLRRHVPGSSAARRAMSVPEWVAHRLGGEAVAEASLASRTGALDVALGTWSADHLAWAGAGDDLFPRVVTAGTPTGRIGALGPGLEALQGAAITLGGHDHLCAAVGAGAVAADQVLDSCGTAEAVVRAVAPLGREAIVAAVSAGVGVSRHTLADRHALLGGTPLGLALGPLRTLLGEACDAPPTDETVAPGSRSLAFSFDDATDSSTLSGIGPGVSARQAWQVAVDATLVRSFRLYEAVERLGGPVRQVVLTGGWSRSPLVAARKARRLPDVRRAAVGEAGARGAALFAGVACGAFTGPEAFPTPTLEPLVDR